MEILSNFLKPKGYVKLTILDKKTGEVTEYCNQRTWVDQLEDLLYSIPLELLKGFGKNTATYDARKVAAHLLKGDNQYRAQYIEWGWGNATPNRSDTDVSGAFNPRVLTPISSFEFATADERALRIRSTLSSQVLTFPLVGGPQPAPSYPYVRELALRTGPIPDPNNPLLMLYPNGLVIARHRLNADQPKPSIETEITAEWLYVYN